MTETREVYRKLGSTGLRCHMLGFGCYRIAAGDEVHEAALVSYLERGGNLIDTSANYGDGLSETLVGQVLAGRERGKVLVVTKGGYIQGQNMELARRRNFPETVYYGEGIWHSIHPDFLETQVERSLERMRLGKIDVYLLHNPEYFLTEKAGRRRRTMRSSTGGSARRSAFSRARSSAARSTGTASAPTTSASRPRTGR